MQINNLKYYEENWIQEISVAGDNIEIWIQGDEKAPDADSLELANRVLKEYLKHVKTAKDRLVSWAVSTPKDYAVESIYFGEYAYGQWRNMVKGFRMTFKTCGNNCDDIYGEYTISLFPNGWPIGFEFSIA